MKNRDIIEMTDREFKYLGNYIENKTGIQMPGSKITLVWSRLSKRLKELGMGSYSEYIDLISSKRGEDEITYLIDAVTTNEKMILYLNNRFYS